MSRVPSQIDKYPILDQIAEGGMGVIYKAEHPTLGRPVILKRLTYTGGEAAVARFRREARIMMGFRNDAIVDVHDHFRSGGSWYIVMEYVDGVSLNALIRDKGRLPSEAALLIVLECARALKYAHDKGVVHRDVKPTNILISRKGEVKLTDFGIAAARDDASSTTLTSTGITLGTVAYMSPEQIASSRDVDRRADIYSLGVTLYEMVTGEAPFPSNFTPQTLSLIQRGKHRPVRKANPRVSPLVRRIIHRTMRPAPRKRFQDLGELLRLLERGLRVTDSAAVQRSLEAFLGGKRPIGVTRRAGAGAAVTASAGVLAVLAASGTLLYREGLVHELLLPHRYGALTVEVQGETVAPPVVTVHRDGAEGPVAVLALERRADRWQSRRVYLPAGPYRVAAQADGLLAWHGLFVAPRDLQRRSAASRKGYRLVVDATRDQRLPHRPVAVSIRVSDAFDGTDLTAGTGIDVKIGDGWSPLTAETLARVVTGFPYEFRFERSGYYPVIQEARVAPHQALLRLGAALVPMAATLVVTPRLTGARLLIDGSSWYLSAERSPVYRKVDPLEGLPRELALAPGTHRLTAEKGELGSTTIDVTLASGERAAVAIEAEAGRLALRRLP